MALSFYPLAIAVAVLTSGAVFSAIDERPSQDPPAFVEGMVGDWVVEHTAIPGPDQEPFVFAGRETARLMGGRWLVREGTRDVAGRTMTSILTIGYDSSRGRFVAAYVDEMQGRMWTYEGDLDAEGRVLTLETEGPFMGDPATLVPFRYVIERVDDGQWATRSMILVPDGEWFEFGRSVYRRP